MTNFKWQDERGFPAGRKIITSLLFKDEVELMAQIMRKGKTYFVYTRVPGFQQLELQKNYKFRSMKQAKAHVMKALNP